MVQQACQRLNEGTSLEIVRADFERCKAELRKEYGDDKQHQQARLFKSFDFKQVLVTKLAEPMPGRQEASDTECGDACDDGQGAHPLRSMFKVSVF